MSEEKKACTLSDLLDMQHALFDKHRHEWAPHDPEHARSYLLWSVEELGEMIAIIKKKGDTAIVENPAVRAHYVEEVADVLMYLMDNIDCYGITGEELSASYVAKFHRNMQRDWHENRTMYEDVPTEK